MPGEVRTGQDRIVPVRNDHDFLVCTAAKLPLGNAPQWIHETYGFMLAVLTFAIVFGAFAANVLFGAMRAVPHAQLETAEAYGMSPRQTFSPVPVPPMRGYALPGPVHLAIGLDQAHTCSFPSCLGCPLY
mgnify:CR=1 FL=1